MNKGIVYYTDCEIRTDLVDKVREQILKANIPIVSVSIKKKIDFGKSIFLENETRSHSTLYKQILTGLKASDADYVFFCEHDVLYHPSHFDFVPPDDKTYYYNGNVYKYRLQDRKVITYDCKWLSQLCANRKHLIRHYEKRLGMIENGEKAWGFEPGTGQSKRIDRYPAENFWSEYPNIDLRHGKNATGIERMDPSEFRNKNNCQNFREVTLDDIQGWDKDFLLTFKETKKIN